MTLIYGFGSGNTFTGGTSYNYVYFEGSGGNMYCTAAGSFTDVFEIGGSDTIDNPDSQGTLAIYKYA